MRFAFVNQPFDSMIPPNQSSIGLWTYHVAPYLARDNTVTVYAKRNRLQTALQDSQGVQYRFVQAIPDRVAKRLSMLLPASRDVRKPFIASTWFGLDNILPVALLLRLQRADIIHVQNISQFVPVLRAACPDAKIVLHMHGEWLSALDYEMMRQRAAKADLILGSSDHITNLIRRRYPEFSSRCGTIYNGVNTETFSPRQSDQQAMNGRGRRIVFVGRVSPEKGVHTLIEAFCKVTDHFPDTQLDIVGMVGAMPMSHIVQVSDDPHVQSLTEYYSEDYGTLLKKLVPTQLANQVHFVGQVSQAELVAYYQSADILVNPSLSESFGMSLIEAMAAEIPVVATRVGGMVEVVKDGQTGLLVEQADSNALAEAMLTLLKNDDLRIRMGKQGRQRVLDRFTWGAIATCLQEQYNRIC